MQLLKPWAFIIHPELRQVWQNAFQLNLTLDLSVFVCDSDVRMQSCQVFKMYEL